MIGRLCPEMALLTCFTQASPSLASDISNMSPNDTTWKLLQEHRARTKKIHSQRATFSRARSQRQNKEKQGQHLMYATAVTTLPLSTLPETFLPYPLATAGVRSNASRLEDDRRAGRPGRLCSEREPVPRDQRHKRANPIRPKLLVLSALRRTPRPHQKKTPAYSQE